MPARGARARRHGLCGEPARAGLRDARDGEGHTHWHACGEGKIHPPHPVSPGRTGWGNCAGRIKLVQTQCCFSQGGSSRRGDLVAQGVPLEASLAAAARPVRWHLGAGASGRAGGGANTSRRWRRRALAALESCRQTCPPGSCARACVCGREDKSCKFFVTPTRYRSTCACASGGSVCTAALAWALARGAVWAVSPSICLLTASAVVALSDHGRSPFQIAQLGRLCTGHMNSKRGS